MWKDEKELQTLATRTLKASAITTPKRADAIFAYKRQHRSICIIRATVSVHRHFRFSTVGVPAIIRPQDLEQISCPFANLITTPVSLP